MTLTPIRIRVLGALIEKEIATPESYPLSLNALVNACNQKSSRDPVLELTDDEVREALNGLEDLGLISTLHDARVPKYEHRIRTVLNLRRDETAVLCLLMLRGPQTPGELRARTERLYTFDDIAAVQSTLDRLAAREQPLTIVLPRQLGSREARYMHLLGGAPEATTTLGPTPTTGNAETTAERLNRLEAEFAALAATVADLKARMDSLNSNTAPLSSHPTALL